jgi:hypothetical protein
MSTEDKGTTQPPPSNATSNVLIPFPADVPKWFINATMMLRSALLGSSWTSLLEMWLKYKEGKDLSDDGKLGTTSHLACITAWIAQAHSAKWRPIIKNANEFKEQFWCWWISVQPKWRKDLKQREGDWQVLQKPRVNGIISVLAALFY